MGNADAYLLAMAAAALAVLVVVGGGTSSVYRAHRARDDHDRAA